MTRVLFVCTGNTCRSPMAEGFFNQYAREKGIDASASSCGLSAYKSNAPSPEAVTACAEYGVDISEHRAVSVDNRLVDEADYIICMTKGQYEVLELMFPQYVKRFSTLAAEDITDPFGGTAELYRTVGKAIHAEAARVCEVIKNSENAYE